MAAKTLTAAFGRGLTKPLSLKTHWYRPASVPDDAGDGFAYNAPWRTVSNSGRPVSEKAVLQLSAAMACVRLLSQTIATLPVGVFRREPDGGRHTENSHPLYELLHNQPNADMTAVDFWQTVVASMLLRGNGFVRKLFIGDRLVALEPLDPSRVTWTSNGDTVKFFYSDGNDKRSALSNRELWVIPAFTLNGRIGISPICYGASVFGAAIAAEEASQALFGNGMSASGFITTQENMWLKPEQREQLRTHLDEFAYSGANTRKNFILEGGMGYTPLAMNPEDAQMLETRSFNVEEICRWFGLPPTLIGHGDKASNWGTGLEQQNIGFLTYSLAPWLRKIEQSVRKNLIDPADKQTLFVEFNVDALLRGDTKSRYESHSLAVNNGLMTRDEIRKMENMPAKGGNAEVLTVQLALAPLDKLGEQPDSTPVKSATEDEQP